MTRLTSVVPPDWLTGATGLLDPSGLPGAGIRFTVPVVELPGFVEPAVNGTPVLLPGKVATFTVPFAERTDACPDCPATGTADPAAGGTVVLEAGSVAEAIGA